jgi:Cu(I)/Ag(I) efflux system membrane fusion protein
MKSRFDTLAPLARVLGTVSVLALLVVLAGCDGSAPSESLDQVMDDTPEEHALKHLDSTYVCPMHPQIVQNEPGICPICGMNLVLQERSADDAEQPAVTIDARTAQNMGVRVTEVKRDTLWKYIETVGYVDYDEDQVTHVHPRASGWVEKLQVGAIGDRVEAGQILLEIYSPEMVQAQEEFLIALRADPGRLTGQRRESLIASGRARLRLLGFPEGVIERLIRTGEVQRTVPVVARQNGVVTAIGLREGMYVTPQNELYTIADLSSVWVQVDVFEHQLDWVSAGRTAEIEVAALPGRTWEGEVEYVYPTLDPRTRTLRVRLQFDNPQGVLKPNMLADVTIYGGPRRDVVAIPREAVIPAADAPRVVRVVEDGVFQPVAVVLGMQSGEWVEVLSGLEAGERIVVSGQFLIDSESNLQASFRRMGEAPAVDPHADH